MPSPTFSTGTKNRGRELQSLIAENCVYKLPSSTCDATAPNELSIIIGKLPPFDMFAVNTYFSPTNLLPNDTTLVSALCGAFKNPSPRG